MIKVFIVAFIVACSSYGQVTQKYSTQLKEKMQGSWDCLSITNEAGEHRAGHVGLAGSFVRYSFKKGRVYVSTAPFDKGRLLFTTFRDSSFSLVLPDKSTIDHHIVFISDTLFISQVKINEGELLTYRFRRSFTYDNPDLRRDYVMSIYYMGRSRTMEAAIKSANKHKYKLDRAFGLGYNYNIPNTKDSYLTSPRFKITQPLNFGSYFVAELDPIHFNDFDSINNLMIFDLKMNNRRLEEIKIIHAPTYAFGAHVYKVLHKNRRRWHQRSNSPMEIRVTLIFIKIKSQNFLHN